MEIRKGKIGTGSANPINAFDPDGRELIIVYYNKNGEQKQFVFTGFHGKHNVRVPKNQFVKDAINAYVFNTSNGGGDNLKNIVSSSCVRVYLMDATDVRNYNNQNDMGGTEYISQGSNSHLIMWESRKAIRLSNGGSQSPASRLEHEADHAWDDFNNHKEHLERAATPDSQYSNAEERRVIEGSERKTAKKNGESVRKNHKGTLYGVISSTSIVPLNIK